MTCWRKVLFTGQGYGRFSFAMWGFRVQVPSHAATQGLGFRLVRLAMLFLRHIRSGGAESLGDAAACIDAEYGGKRQAQRDDLIKEF